ncbi:MAG: NUDIX hydrolase [Oscillospiraceae bacterium]|nr:NUDIX hydrolase [Oscillospiraceae bacterium]
MYFEDAVKAYVPMCEQEARDREFFLRFIAGNSNCLIRENDTAHFTASSWIVNPERSKVLLVYHNIYGSWSWTGGHADGESDLAAVALREAKEETGIENARLVSPSPISLEILTVDGHMKRGEFVHSHLHLNLTYLIEADESEFIRIKADENSGVGWFTPEEMFNAVSEKWMAENIYKKLCERSL